ncbi:MAG: RNA polymerase sigma-70 factor, partial [Bacteroidota bacterium]
MDKDNVDKKLFEAVKKGDKKAFEILFKLYYSSLCKSAVQIVKDSGIAEEIVSDFFLIIWNKRQSIEIHSTVSRYFYRAVKNSALTKIASLKQIPSDINDFVSTIEDPNSGPLNKMISKEVILEWEEKIAQLPDQRQKAFRMNKLQGMSCQEIARCLSISEKTVRNHVFLAVKSLKTELNLNVIL